MSSRYPQLGAWTMNETRKFQAQGWDLATLGGHEMPGLCRITGARIKLNLDKKKPVGCHGGTPTVDGLEGQVFHLEVIMSTNEQLERFAEICEVLLPRPRDERFKDAAATAGAAAGAAVANALAPLGGAIVPTAVATAKSISNAARKNGVPLVLDHPQVRHLRIVQVIIVGCSQLEFFPEAGVSGVKCTIDLFHDIPKIQGASHTRKGAPLRKVPNARSKAGQPQNYVEKNPPPTAQADVFGPPDAFTPLTF